jgi:hypothetical protein
VAGPTPLVMPDSTPARDVAANDAAVNCVAKSEKTTTAVQDFLVANHRFIAASFSPEFIRWLIRYREQRYQACEKLSAEYERFNKLSAFSEKLVSLLMKGECSPGEEYLPDAEEFSGHEHVRHLTTIFVDRNPTTRQRDVIKFISHPEHQDILDHYQNNLDLLQGFADAWHSENPPTREEEQAEMLYHDPMSRQVRYAAWLSSPQAKFETWVEAKAKKATLEKSALAEREAVLMKRQFESFIRDEPEAIGERARKVFLLITRNRRDCNSYRLYKTSLASFIDAIPDPQREGVQAFCNYVCDTENNDKVNLLVNLIDACNFIMQHHCFLSAVHNLNFGNIFQGENLAVCRQRLLALLENPRNRKLFQHVMDCRFDLMHKAVQWRAANCHRADIKSLGDSMQKVFGSDAKNSGSNHNEKENIPPHQAAAAASPSPTLQPKRLVVN